MSIWLLYIINLPIEELPSITKNTFLLEVMMTMRILLQIKLEMKLVILEFTLNTLRLGCPTLNLLGSESIAMELLLIMVLSKMIEYS